MDAAVYPWLEGIAAINVALALGLVPAMTVFFGRMAFRELDADGARRLLRACFPVYHAMLTAFSLVAAAALAMPRPFDAGLMLGVAVTALFSWFWLMPMAHRLDDMQRQGRDVGRELIRAQSRSSFVIVAQLAALLAVAVRLAVM